MFTIQTTPINFAVFEQKVTEARSFTAHVAVDLDTIIDWAVTETETGYSHEDYIISQVVDTSDAPDNHEFTDYSYEPVSVVDGKIVFAVTFTV